VAGGLILAGIAKSARITAVVTAAFVILGFRKQSLEAGIQHSGIAHLALAFEEPVMRTEQNTRHPATRLSHDQLFQLALTAGHSQHEISCPGAIASEQLPGRICLESIAWAHLPGGNCLEATLSGKFPGGKVLTFRLKNPTIRLTQLQPSKFGRYQGSCVWDFMQLCRHPPRQGQRHRRHPLCFRLHQNRRPPPLDDQHCQLRPGHPRHQQQRHLNSPALPAIPETRWQQGEP
jgi:hypothetical protein